MDSCKGTLDLVIITMTFPMASETFASSRLRSLSLMGHRMRVFALRTQHPNGRKLARERAVDEIPTSHNGLGSNLRGVIEALKRPALLWSTITWLLGATRRNREHLVKALAVVPRAFDILNTLEHDPPDVLHTEWGHYPTLVARLVQQRLPDVTVSISLIAYDLTTGFGGTVDVVRDADVIRTQARANVEHIAAFAGVPESRVSVVHDGVEFARVRRLYARVPKVAGRCAVAARLVPEKGIDDALRVFAAARVVAPHATLRVLGDGPELQRLQRLAGELGLGDSVEFAGHVSHERAIEEFSVAEVLLHMSHAERLPNVVKEAMACRCAVITTRTVGIEELVEDTVTGFIVDHGDLDAATSIATALVRGELPVNDIGAAAYRAVAGTFDHERNVEQLVDLWHAAARPRGNHMLRSGRVNSESARPG